jgi:hypothetical protein
METLLIVAIVVTALSVAIQAGALLAMYLLSRRVTDNVNGLVNESHKLMAPLEHVANNFKRTSDDLAEVGKDARVEVARIQALMAETADVVRDEIDDLRDRFTVKKDEVEQRVMSPFREWSALANGFTAGVRTFFRRRQTEREIDQDIRHTPAA